MLPSDVRLDVSPAKVGRQALLLLLYGRSEFQRSGGLFKPDAGVYAL